MTCPNALDDGAYVLGALTPADRAGFESHLGNCPICRESVASLAVLPGLLGRLGGDVPTFLNLDGSETVSPALLPRILAAASGERRRARRIRRFRATAALLAAACMAALVGFGVHLIDQRGDGTPVIVQPTNQLTFTAMQPLGTNLNVTGQVGLADTAAGTRVEMHCQYAVHNDGMEHRPWPVFLVVVPLVGDPEQIGVWMAEGGQSLEVTGMTRYHPDAIASVELRRRDGEALLRWSPA